MRSNEKQNFTSGSGNERERHMKDRDKIKSIRYEGGWILDIGYKYVWDSIHLKLFIFTHESFFLLLLGFFFSYVSY